jgi:hypothetical protein
MAEKTFGPAEVAIAAGIPRGTFHSQLARSHTPGPGQGQSRRFTLEQAVRIAATEKLRRLGIAVAIASACCASITSDDYAAGARTLLVLGARAAGMPTVDKLPASRLREALDRMPCLAILDMCRIAADTQRILNDPATRFRADPRIRISSEWQGAPAATIAVPDPSAQAEPPVRKRAAPARKKLEPAVRRAFAGAE